MFSSLAMPGFSADLKLEQLGKELFFDESLSNPPGQSCATCHDAGTGGTGHDSAINEAGAVEPGVVFTRSGNRKPPTVAYGGYTPILHQCMGGGMDGGMGGGGMGGGGMGGCDMMAGTFVGGLFWDGRATGWYPDGRGTIILRKGERSWPENLSRAGIS